MVIITVLFIRNFRMDSLSKPDFIRRYIDVYLFRAFRNKHNPIQPE